MTNFNAANLAKASFAMGLLYARQRVPSGYFSVNQVITEYEEACERAGVSVHTFISPDNLDELRKLGEADQASIKAATKQLCGVL